MDFASIIVQIVSENEVQRVGYGMYEYLMIFDHMLRYPRFRYLLYVLGKGAYNMKMLRIPKERHRYVPTVRIS